MLTNTQVAQAKKSTKAYKLTDGAGLYLEVTPSGGKHWRYRFRLHGKESLFSLGEYPSVSLSAARKRREESREPAPPTGSVRSSRNTITTTRCWPSTGW